MDLLHKFFSAPADFLLTYALPFVVVLSVLVFVHEWGHFIIARLCGVKVETFSIGFGREIFGWTNKQGMRWKFSWIPLGGYVQMFGDTDPASASSDKKRAYTAAEKRVAFFSQGVGQRAAIVFAGPAINFIFAILILSGLYAVQGQPFTPAVVGKLVVGAPAEKAGIRVDDKIIQIDNTPVARFQEISQYVSLNFDKELTLHVLRSAGKHKWRETPVLIKVKPELITDEDRFGFRQHRGRIGLMSPKGAFELKTHTPFSAFLAANKEVWDISAGTLQAIGQMITGTRKADELGGILRIGAYAGDYAQQGIVSLIVFMAMLSVNLGLINLLPIPMLDGGHLAFYAIETLKGKPVGDRGQEYALRVGLAFLVAIMMFAMWNDLVQLRVVDYLKNLVS